MLGADIVTYRADRVTGAGAPAGCAVCGLVVLCGGTVSAPESTTIENAANARICSARTGIVCPHLFDRRILRSGPCRNRPGFSVVS